nr:MAG TPA: hypothetical protein [Caudoviricetes sp.]
MPYLVGRFFILTQACMFTTFLSVTYALFLCQSRFVGSTKT